MENIKITIADNGTTTLATAGKYCDRNVEVEVNVAGGGGSIEVEPIVLKGSQLQGCMGPVAGAYVELFGDTITTQDLTSIQMMFNNNTATKLPDLNCKAGTSIDCSNAFNNCVNLKEAPKILNCQPKALEKLFYSCSSLNVIPSDLCDTWDWSALDGATNAYSGATHDLFSSCNSLTSYPRALIEHANPTVYSSYVYFKGCFYHCFILDMFEDLPLPYTATYTSNVLSTMFERCNRASKITFETNEDGSPKIMPWKSQTLDLSQYLGYASVSANCLNKSPLITADKEVKDDATYAALKDDPYWFTAKVEYSRYNHDSAVATINSLPDCSATGTNTIKFKGAAGSKTDGGAINTLTEAEIAVATAKGWTVSFT